MVAAFIKRSHTQYALCDSDGYLREIIKKFWSVKCPSVSKTLPLQFLFFYFFDTLNIINIEFYLFISLSVTLTIFQGHSGVKLFCIYSRDTINASPDLT